MKYNTFVIILIMQHTESRRYDAIVIGAGPTGLAVVGNLLDQNIKKILWIDPEFNSGRLSAYPEVPSNTKVMHFEGYWTQSKTFTDIIKHYKNDPERNPFYEMSTMDHDKGCNLIYAIHMTNRLTQAIRELYSKEVEFFKGYVKSLQGTEVSEKRIRWQVIINQTTSFESNCVILATGSQPRSLKGEKSLSKKFGVEWAPDSYSPEEINLDDALTPSILKEKVRPDDRVAVIGTSHSGILVLKNLAELPNRPKVIDSFSRSPLLYATYYDDWILYDNTGLKGLAAVWAKEMLETNKIPNLNRISVEKNEEEIYRKYIPQCTKIVYAIGYDRNPLPSITIKGYGSLNDKDVTYEKTTGQLLESGLEGSKILYGLYGYGIGFPEVVKDKVGNVEEAVGLIKFMKYQKRVIPSLVVPYILDN